MRIGLALIQIICVLIQIVCLISMMKDDKEIESLLKKSGLKSLKVKRPKIKFYLCQWLALHCRKPIIIVYGRRRSGKTFTAFQLMKRAFRNHKNIGVLCGNSTMAKWMYDESQTQIGVTERSVKNWQIWNENSRITFFPTFDIEKAYLPGSDIPDILIADECDDPVKLIMQNDYLANHYMNWKVKKIFITATPATNIDKKMMHETIGKDRVKIYRWGLHCGPRIPRKLLKEMKRGGSND